MDRLAELRTSTLTCLTRRTVLYVERLWSISVREAWATTGTGTKQEEGIDAAQVVCRCVYERFIEAAPEKERLSCYRQQAQYLAGRIEDHDVSSVE